MSWSRCAARDLGRECRSQAQDVTIDRVSELRPLIWRYSCAGPKGSLDDYLVTHSIDTFCALEPVPICHPARAEREAAAHIEVVDLADFMAARPAAEQDPLIEGGLLPDRSLMVEGGPAKHGKSILAMNMGLCLATGRRFLRWGIPKSVRVFYLQAEISEASLWDRFTKMLAGVDGGADAVRGQFFLATKKGLKLETKDGFEAVQRIVGKVQPRVLILDPLRRFLLGDENKSGDVGRFFDRLDRLVEAFGLSVILVHHFGKPSLEGRDGAQRLRGSSVIFDVGDSYLSVTRRNLKESKRYVRLGFELRNADDPPPLSLYRNPDTLRFEEVEEESGRVTPADVQALLASLGEVTGGLLAKRLADEKQCSARTAERAMSEALSQGLVDRRPLTEPGKREKSWLYFPAPGGRS